MAYVILSRITGAYQLFLKEFDQKKIYCSAVAKAEAKRLRARSINHQMTEWDVEKEGAVRLCTINARSLHQHYQDLNKDEFIHKSDILCIQVGRGDNGLKNSKSCLIVPQNEPFIVCIKISIS